MNKIQVYSAAGSKKSEITAPANFKLKDNPALLAQALRVYEDNKHLIPGKTKTRGEVRGSTRKIYRQKGTGFARHGARSAPIFVGGGIAHGPKGIKRILSLPSKMKKQALGLAFSAKLLRNDLVVIDGLASFKKTKEVNACIDKISKSLKKGRAKITFIVPENVRNYYALKNIKNSTIKIFKNLNPYDLYYGGLIIFDQNIFEKNHPAGEKRPKKIIRKEAK